MVNPRSAGDHGYMVPGPTGAESTSASKGRQGISEFGTDCRSLPFLACPFRVVKTNRWEDGEAARGAIIANASGCFRAVRGTHRRPGLPSARAYGEPVCRGRTSNEQDQGAGRSLHDLDGVMGYSQDSAGSRDWSDDQQLTHGGTRVARAGSAAELAMSRSADFEVADDDRRLRSQ